MIRRFTKPLLLGAFALPASFSPLAAAQCDPVKLLAEEGEASDRLGSWVALDGWIMAAGAPARDAAGSDSGAVLIYRFDGLEWKEEAELIAPDGAFGDHLGHCVGLSGEWLVAGAPDHDAEMDREGAAYVFREVKGNWEFVQKLTAPDGDRQPVDQFGYGVAIDGDVIVVGARGDDGNGEGAGAAYVFQRQGTSWVFMQKLMGSEQGTSMVSAFGVNVDVDGDRLVAAAPWDDAGGVDEGAIHVYLHLDEEWRREAVLTPDFGFNGAFFGFPVKISGDVILAGMPGDGGVSSSEGSVRPFHFENDRWVQKPKIKAAISAHNGNFGRGLGLSGDLAVIGAYGVSEGRGIAHLFQRFGSSWVAIEELPPFNVVDTLGTPPYYGFAADVGGGMAVVAAPFEDNVRGGDAGYLYFHDAGGCVAQCGGGERIKKAVCKAKGAGFQISVKLVGGVAGDTFRLSLPDGASVGGTIDAQGRGKAVFRDVQASRGEVTAEWHCGAAESRSYECR